MVEVNDQLIDKLSDLAKLRFEGEEREHIKQDLHKMIAFVEKLQELDTEGVEPLIHVLDEANHLREDQPEMPLNHKSALKSAPKADSDYFRVPKFGKRN